MEYSPLLRFEGYPAWVRLADAPGDKWAGVVVSATTHTVLLDLTTPVELPGPAAVVVEVLDRDQICRFFTQATPAPDRPGRLLLAAPVALAPIQRRLHQRAYVSIPVRFWPAGEPEAGARRGHAVSLSPDGIGFFTQDPPAPGAPLQLRLHHPLAARLGALAGEVVRVAAQAERWHQVGVRLGPLSGEAAAGLRVFVAGERWLAAGHLL